MSDQEIAQLEEDMAADIDGYFKDAAKVERYGQLIEAKETGTSAPAGPSTNQQRKAELEKMMAAPGNSSPYWHDEELQREYAALLDRAFVLAHEVVQDDISRARRLRSGEGAD